MGYSVTWTLRNIPTYTRDQAIKLTALTGDSMAGVVAIAIDRYYGDCLLRLDLERDAYQASHAS